MISESLRTPMLFWCQYPLKLLQNTPKYSKIPMSDTLPSAAENRKERHVYRCMCGDCQSSNTGKPPFAWTSVLVIENRYRKKRLLCETCFKEYKGLLDVFSLEYAKTLFGKDTPIDIPSRAYSFAREMLAHRLSTLYPPQP